MAVALEAAAGGPLSTASRLCDRLIAAEMLEREPGRSDRREISLHLTPAARRLLTELRADRRQRIEGVLAGMSLEGRQALLLGVREFDEVAGCRSPSADPLKKWPTDEPSVTGWLRATPLPNGGPGGDDIVRSA